MHMILPISQMNSKSAVQVTHKAPSMESQPLNACCCFPGLPTLYPVGDSQLIMLIRMVRKQSLFKTLNSSKIKKDSACLENGCLEYLLTTLVSLYTLVSKGLRSQTSVGMRIL